MEGPGGNDEREVVAFGLLGPFSVTVAGQSIACGGLKQRAVLAMLTLEANRSVPTARLIDGLWGDDPPDGALGTLQVYVSGLRKALPRPGGVSPIATTAHGYRLDADPQAVDLMVVERLVGEAAAASRAGEDRRGVELLERALSQRRGDPLGEFASFPFAEGRAVAARHLLDVAEDERTEALLRLGAHRAVLGSLEQAVRTDPMRELRWRQLALARYRDGRQADALAAIRSCRAALRDELGVDASPETAALELAILNHDPQLAAPTGSPASPARRLPPPGPATVPAGSGAALEVVLPDGRTVALAGVVLIGRNDECPIRIDDPEVSRHHAELQCSNRGVVLSDLSLNGTWVNGVRVAAHRLQAGDVIRVGSHELVVRSVAEVGRHAPAR